MLLLLPLTQGHNREVTSVAFSLDGRQLATGSGDKTARVWDLASGQCTSTLEVGARDVMRGEEVGGGPSVR